ncbi:uncharacterized protein LOC135812070 [Sycon ciliatum]|uniref:uncharacterized protein LOC135812070 n=1 Tax=Sycon ciliatum TaxID=27933 RepID=UPI0031F61F60
MGTDLDQTHTAGAFLRGLTVILVLSLQCLYRGAEAYKVGMKYAQCNTLRVEHGTAASQPLQSSPYRITTDTTCGYQAGQLYNLTITGPALSGFVCRGQKTRTILLTDAVGSFPTRFSLPFTAGSPCYPSSSGLMNLYQTSKTHKYASPLRLVWQAPAADEGGIEITCSLVTNFNVFYTTQRSVVIPFNPSVNPKGCIPAPLPATVPDTRVTSKPLLVQGPLQRTGVTIKPLVQGPLQDTGVTTKPSVEGTLQNQSDSTNSTSAAMFVHPTSTHVPLLFAVVPLLVCTALW